MNAARNENEEFPPTLCILEKARSSLSYERCRSLRELAAQEKDFSLPDNVSAGTSLKTGLILADSSSIALRTRGSRLLGYRVSHLAVSDDRVISGNVRCPAYEHYCCDLLGLRNVQTRLPSKGEPVEPISDRTVKDSLLFGEICDRSVRSGGLNIRPYMGTEAVWSLARAVADKTGVPVTVEAPPPELCSKVNDKGWFATQVRRVLGAESTPAFFVAHTPDELTTGVTQFALLYSELCIKLPNSAGSLGNLRVDSQQLKGLDRRKLRAHLVALMDQAGWRSPFPLQVEAWRNRVLSSPSVQLWIPRQGVLIAEGIFQQCLSDQGEFEGAEPAELPPDLSRRILDEAFELGFYLQSLGYYGRCSMDAILVGDQLNTCHLQWIECNGRWGGASIPMTLFNRLGIDWRKGTVRAVAAKVPNEPLSFEQILQNLDDLLFQGEHGVILLTPTRLERGDGLDCALVASSQGELDELFGKVQSRLGIDTA